MKKDTSAQLNTIDGQLLAIALSIIPIALSFLILYNQKLKLEQKEPLFTDEEVTGMLLISRIITFLIIFYFLLDTLKSYEEETDEEKKETTRLQLIASLLTLVASIISLYIASLALKAPITTEELEPL